MDDVELAMVAVQRLEWLGLVVPLVIDIVDAGAAADAVVAASVIAFVVPLHMSYPHR